MCAGLNRETYIPYDTHARWTTPRADDFRRWFSRQCGRCQCWAMSPWKYIDEIFPKPLFHFGCVRPPGFREIRLGNSFQGVCCVSSIISSVARYRSLVSSLEYSSTWHYTALLVPTRNLTQQRKWYIAGCTLPLGINGIDGVRTSVFFGFSRLCLIIDVHRSWFDQVTIHHPVFDDLPRIRYDTHFGQQSNLHVMSTSEHKRA